MSGKKILEMKDITKTFPGVKALDHVSFEVYEKEILALVGENGAGKSTLMKVLSGAYADSTYSGEIYVSGKQVHFKNSAQSEEAGIAMIYQEISMHLDMTVAENIFLGRWSRTGFKINWRQMRKDSAEYLRMVKLDIEPDEILGNLSASQQQLVSIARALSKHPRILVLDEPTSPLTLSESENLFGILHELKEKGTSSILISHKLDEVFANADRITVLRDGKTISSAGIEAIDRHRVVTDMVGREIKTFYPKEKVPVGDVVFEIKNFKVPHPYAARKNIVEDISLQARAGEILGIAGLVGAGRSETMNAAFGKTSRAAGSVFVSGKEVAIKTPADAIRAGIALVTEDRKADGIIGIHSIRHNETLAALKELFPRGRIRTRQEEKAARKYYDRMNVKAPGMDTPVQQLSGGNQQKVVLAKVMLTDPDVIIFDEPTRGIDVGAKAEIYKRMAQLAQEGKCVVMISSEMPEILGMSDRIMVMSQGRVTGIVDNRDVTQEQIFTMACE